MKRYKFTVYDDGSSAFVEDEKGKWVLYREIPLAGQMLTDEQIYEALEPIADEEIMARNKRSIVDAGRDLLRKLELK